MAEEDFGGFGGFEEVVDAAVPEGEEDLGGFGADFDGGGFGDLPEDTESESPAAAVNEISDEEHMKARRGSTIVAVDGKKSGFLKVLVVKTLGGKKWIEKYFILADGKLKIQELPNSPKSDTIDLTHALGFHSDPKGTGERFSLVTRTKTFYFTAKTKDDADVWIDNLQIAKKEYKGGFGASVNTNMMF